MTASQSPIELLHTDVLEPATCSACGQEVPSPADGRWRWARGEKDYGSIQAAEQRIATLTNDRFEFRALVDSQGRARIVSRRKLQPAS